jgi:hypothetical protein
MPWGGLMALWSNSRINTSSQLLVFQRQVALLSALLRASQRGKVNQMRLWMRGSKRCLGYHSCYYMDIQYLGGEITVSIAALAIPIVFRVAFVVSTTALAIVIVPRSFRSLTTTV